MSSKQNRRTFLKTGALLSAGALINRPNLFANASGFSDTGNVDLSVVQGDDYYANTYKAVNALGGMEKFVKKIPGLVCWSTRAITSRAHM